METSFISQDAIQHARASVSEESSPCFDLVVFELEGKVRMARVREDKIRPGDRMGDFMTAAEWEFLRKNCLSFACARALVDTRLGAMIVFCNFLASMHVMVGVIFRVDRSAVAKYYHGRVTMVDAVSNRMDAVMRRLDQVDADEVASVADVATTSFAALATAAFSDELGDSLLGAVDQVMRRIALLARLVGCRVDCRSLRSFAPYVHDFNGDAFVSVMLCLLFFAYEKSPSRSAVMEIDDLDGRMLIVFRCDLPDGVREVFVNRQYRYSELTYCDALAGEWRFLLECACCEVDGVGRLRIVFCPKIQPFDKLQVKTDPDGSRKPRSGT